MVARPPSSLGLGWVAVDSSHFSGALIHAEVMAGYFLTGLLSLPPPPPPLPSHARFTHTERTFLCWLSERLPTRWRCREPFPSLFQSATSYKESQRGGGGVLTVCGLSCRVGWAGLGVAWRGVAGPGRAWRCGECRCAGCTRTIPHSAAISIPET